MVSSLEPYLTYWRTTTARDREIVEAVVRPEHRGPSEALRRALEAFDGVHYWASGADTGRVVLIRALVPPPKERWWLHVALFLGTFITVQLGGSFLLLGGSPHSYPSLAGGWSERALGVFDWLRGSMVGMPFAMALMAILLAHEMGHYLTAKRYGINASPPYFLPAPVEINFIGTFGAFIRLRTPVVDRRQLMDVGAAGPWVGFAVALLMLVVGFQHSYLVPTGEFDAPMVIEFGRRNWYLGDSLITWGMRHTLLGAGTAVLHPLAVAGWTGMLVTALNLIPLGQLDGGHILYALFGDRQRHLAVAAWFGLLVIGWWYKPWWFLAILVLVLGGGHLSHPRVLERLRPLPPSRIPLGWASVVLFALTFAPVPLTL